MSLRDAAIRNLSEGLLTRSSGSEIEGEFPSTLWLHNGPHRGRFHHSNPRFRIFERVPGIRVFSRFYLSLGDRAP